MKPKLAPFFRNSSNAQKNEETIIRQTDGFKQRWPELSKTYDLYERIPGSTMEDQFFVDEAFNLETWDETTNFYELMQLCQAREVDAIFISEDNRLFRSRSSELKGRIIDIIQNNRIKVFDKSGEVQLGLNLEVRAAMGTEDKRAFMIKCHEAKISRIKQNGRPPTGRMPFCFHWDKREQKWSLVNDEVRLLKCAVGLSIGKVFDEMPNEVKALVHLNPDGLNDRRIAEELSKLGFSKHPFYERINLSYMMRKRANRDLNSAAIEKMFREDHYRGVLEVSMLNPNAIGIPDKEASDRETLSINVPRVLTNKDWELLQSKRRARRKWVVHNLKHDYLCKDLLICADCGIPLAARPRRINKYIRSRDEIVTLDFFYYTCARKPKVSHRRCNSGKHHKCEIIDELVWNSFISVIQNPDNLMALSTSGASSDAREKRKSEIEKIIPRYEAELKELDNRRSRANRLFANGRIEEHDYLDQLQELKTLKIQLETEIRSAKREARELSQGPDLSGAITKLAKLDLSAENLPFERRRNLLRDLVSKILITNDAQITVVLEGGIEWIV